MVAMEDKKTIKMLVLSLTGKCNLSCKYCYAAKHPQVFMTMKTATKAINLAAASGKAFILQITGGEPLLAWTLLQNIIRYVHQRKIPAIMQIQTNGVLLTDAIAAELKAARVGIGVSLDGRPGQNDLQRCFADGAGTSSKIIAGIEKLKEHGMAIGITCVVTESNAARLDGIVAMAYYLGNVRRIGFDLLRGQGRGAALQPAASASLVMGLEKAFALADEMEKLTGRKLLFTQIERVEKLAKGELCGFAHCHAMNGQTAYVDATGNIYACGSLIGNQKFYLGDVEQGIDVHKQIEISNYIKASMTFCQTCAGFSLCGGACFARWYGRGGKGAYDLECSLKRTAADCWKSKQGGVVNKCCSEKS